MSTVLALVLAQAPAWGETEAYVDRRERLEVIAHAASIEAAAAPPGWRWTTLAMTATLLATSYEEGQRWALSVHDGSRLGDCDDDGTNCRARCVNQLHLHPTWVPGPMWRATTGTDLYSTQLCMRGAVRILSHYSARCVSPWRAKHDLEGALARVVAGYGTGHSCEPAGRPWARARAKRAVKWLRELEAA